MFEQSILNRIQVIEHSGIRIDGDTVIYIDPINIIGSPHDADLILFTHPHFDHFSPKDVKKILKDSTVIAAPKSMEMLCKLLLRKNPAALLPNQSTELAGVSVQTFPAYNKAKPFHMKAFGWLGYILTIGETTVYVSGDTDLTEACMQVSCDIALLPVGGFYTMNPAQAAELANVIQPHTVIPIHYGKLLGGSQAAEQFRKALRPEIQADIRENAFSSILVSMYTKALVLCVVAAVVGYLVGKYL